MNHQGGDTRSRTRLERVGVETILINIIGDESV